jgi:hypothetical protein
MRLSQRYLWIVLPYGTRIMLCRLLKVNRLCGGTCHLHLQDRIIKLCLPLNSCWFPAWYILRLWRWRSHVILKRPLSLNGLPSVISQKTELFTIIYLGIPYKMGGTGFSTSWATTSLPIRAASWTQLQNDGWSYIRTVTIGISVEMVTTLLLGAPSQCGLNAESYERPQSG